MSTIPRTGSLSEDGWLTLIHLSDIHFTRKDSESTRLDQVLQKATQDDIVTTCQSLSPVTGILIGGDVAYAGKAEEYAIARDWLNELSRRVEIPAHHAWVVPGNHDVDRQQIGKRLSAAHKEIRTAVVPKTPSNVYDEHVRGDPDGHILFTSPLGEYNAFAALYGCDIDSIDRMWETSFALNDSSVLRIRGLASALISDAHDDENENRLLVPVSDFAIAPDAEVACMYLCHHPPEWLHERDAVNDHLNATAHIQLFGHKHRAQIDVINDKVRVGAGALQPSRDEPGWNPRYNVLRLRVQTIGLDPI